MQSISIANFNTDVANIINNTIVNSEITEVKTDIGIVVLLDKKKWLEINETLMLINDKTSLKTLLEGHVLRESNEIIGKTLDEVFNDV